VPGNLPLLDPILEKEGLNREAVYEAMYPGHVEISTDIARQTNLRSVVKGLYMVAAQNGRVVQGQERKLWRQWEAALHRLEQEHQVTTLAELAALNRVQWWRTRVPRALRTALNTFLYHNRLPAVAVRGDEEDQQQHEAS